MPTVEKTRGGQVYIRSVGQQFAIGDRAEVSESEAQYLVEERGDFELVDAGEQTGSANDADYAINTESGELLDAADATVDQIETAIAEVEDPDAIRYILDAERDGQHRTTAIEALEARLDELEG